VTGEPVIVDQREIRRPDECRGDAKAPAARWFSGFLRLVALRARDKLTGMAVTDQAGTLADVRHARRALSGKFEPPFPVYVVWPAIFALCFGSKSLLLSLVGAVALGVVPFVLVWWQSTRAGFIRPRRVRLFSRRALVLIGVVCLIVALAMAVVLLVPVLHARIPMAMIWHTGTPMAYAVLFVIFVVPLIAAATLPWRIDPYGADARPMREVPDQPAVVDPVIEPGRRIMVCAILAGVDWIDAEFLAKTLRISDEELSRQTAELVAAQYISVCPDGERWWFNLTPVGRAAYRRHLRALQRAA
jgi:hypothetical protein